MIFIKNNILYIVLILLIILILISGIEIISSFETKVVENYSHGMQKKLGLIALATTNQEKLVLKDIDYLGEMEILQRPLNIRSRILLKRFLHKYQFFIYSISWRTKDKILLNLKLENSNQIELSKKTPFDLSEVPWLTRKGFNRVSINNKTFPVIIKPIKEQSRTLSNLIIVFNPIGLLKHNFSLFNVKDDLHSWIITLQGNLKIIAGKDIIGQISHEPINIKSINTKLKNKDIENKELINSEILPCIRSLKQGFEGTGTFTNQSVVYITAYSPITLTNKIYGIGFAVQKNNILCSISSFSKIIIGNASIVIICLIILFYTILSRERKSNKTQLMLQKKNEENNIKFKTLFETSGDAICLIAKRGIFDCNDAFLKTFLIHTKSDCLNKTILSFSPPLQPNGEKSEDIAKRHYDNAEKLGNIRFGWTYKKMDGTLFPTDILLTNMTIEGKKIIQIVIRDITEATETQKRLRKSMKIAKAANRAKSEFLTNMSHELRTPMNAIIGISDLLMVTKLTSEQANYISSLQVSADSLLLTINNMLDISKIEKNQLELEKVTFNFQATINNVNKKFANEAKIKGLEYNSTIDYDIPEMFYGDKIRLCQILTNLLNNSIKFTKKGEISVYIRLKKKDGKKCTIEFSISDTGTGIPVDQIKRLFENFTQLDSSATREYGGIGLGLPISKKLCSMMGGDLTVNSLEGKGSTFSFSIIMDEVFIQKVQTDEVTDKTLSIINDAGKDDVCQNTTGQNATGQKATGKDDAGKEATENLQTKKLSKIDTVSKSQNFHVLIVEDVKVNQMVTKAILKKNNLNTSIANNGLEAVTMVQENYYDLILMDIQMPKMDGLTATKKIRAMEETRACQQDLTSNPIPIIALTANAMKGDRQICIDAGMDDYIAKPVTSKKLMGMLEKYISLTKDTAVEKIDLKSQNIPHDKSSFTLNTQNTQHKKQSYDKFHTEDKQPVATISKVSELEIFNKSELLNRIENDNDLLKIVLNTFIESTPQYLKEIEAAIENNDSEIIRVQAHTVKGSSGNVSAPLMMHTAHEIEKAGKIGDIATSRKLLQKLEKEFEMFKEVASEA